MTMMKSLSRLSAEIDGLIVAVGGLPPSPSVIKLEREIALLVWRLRMRRMSSAEIAAYHNGLAHRRWISGEQPVYTMQSRIEDLIEELKLW